MLVYKKIMAVNKKFLEIQQIKFDLFKSQNPENGKFDVEFEIGGKKLYGHKNMLNLISDTFDTMLSDRWNKNKDGIVKITDYNFDDFYEFITFLYSGQCKLTNQNICALVDMAEYYGVPIFKSYCEDYLMDMKYEIHEVFKLFEVSCTYNLVQYKNYVKSIILVHGSNLLKSDSFLNEKKSLVKEIVILYEKKLKAEDLFQAVYKWSEKQAIDRQQAENDPMFNLNNAIKSEICDFLPYIDFAGMNVDFLLEFVVARGFIFQSFEQLSQILIKARKECNIIKSKLVSIKVLAGNDVLLTGKIPSDDFAVYYIKSLKSIPSFDRNDYAFFWKGKYCIPPTPSSVKKSNERWYLIYDSSGRFGVQYSSKISNNAYLIAEMLTIIPVISFQNYMIEICE